MLRLICTSESGEVTSMQAVYFACQELCFNMEWVTLRNVIELAE